MFRRNHPHRNQQQLKSEKRTSRLPSTATCLAAALTVLASAVAILATASAAAAQSRSPEAGTTEASSGSQLVIVDAVPLVGVDVTVNGVSAGVVDADLGSVLDLPDGDYQVTIELIDRSVRPGQPSPDRSLEQLLAASPLTIDVTVGGPPRLVIAHLDTDGRATVSTETVPSPPAGESSCVAVFHGGATPPLDVLVDENLVRRNLTNGTLSPALSARPGPTTLALTPAGSGLVAAGPLDFSIDDDGCSVVVLQGSAADGLSLTPLQAVQAAPDDGWGELLGTSTLTVLNAVDDAITTSIDGTGTDPARLAAGETVEVELEAGVHDVAVSAGGFRAEATARSTGGAGVTAVAHRDEAGQATVSVFVDDGTRLEPGRGCVDVRHTAQSPPVDVYVDDTLVAQNLGSGSSSGRIPLTPGSTTVVVTPVGSATPVLDPTPVRLVEGDCVLLHLTGNADRPTSLAMTGLDGVSRPGVPTQVPTGSAAVGTDPVAGNVGAVFGVAGNERQLPPALAPGRSSGGSSPDAPIATVAVDRVDPAGRSVVDLLLLGVLGLLVVAAVTEWVRQQHGEVNAERWLTSWGQDG